MVTGGQCSRRSASRRSQAKRARRDLRRKIRIQSRLRNHTNCDSDRAASGYRWRRGHRRTTHHAPQVQASGPNEVWSWDISRLRGPHHRSWFYLYVVIDIFSRKIVAWTVDTAESTEVARTLVGTACAATGSHRSN